MNAESPKIWIVTGNRGAGKTRFCQKVVFETRKKGLKTGGVLSIAEFTDGVKTGINVEDLSTGETRRLASARDDIQNDATPHWKFDEVALAWGADILQRSVPCDLLVVDELGPLELEHSRGWMEGIKALDGGRFRSALVVIRPELLHLGLQHWPEASVISIDERQTEVEINIFLDHVLNSIL